MTSTLDRVSPAAASLEDRLADLERQRTETLLEMRPEGCGDDADRATNVDAHIRLAMLERRIADVQEAIAELSAAHADTDTIAFGRTVTLDFGDGPETYVFGSAEQAPPGGQVVTPDSALGRVLRTAHVGDSATYTPRPGRTLQVRILDVA